MSPDGELNSDEPGYAEPRGWVVALQLYEDNKTKVLATLRVLLGSQEDANDAMQEALIAAACHVDQLTTGKSADAWFQRIAINKGLDRLREQSRRPTLLRGSAVELAALAERAQLSRKFEVLGIVAGAALEDRLVVAEALEFLSTLPDKHRFAYLMKHFLGMTPSDIAEVIGCAVKHVSTYVWRAQRALDNKFPHASRATNERIENRPQGGRA